jgi:hypothetical protein
VQHASAVGSSLEELYQAVENLCVHKHSAMLLGKLRAACDHHIAAMLTELGTHVSKDPEAFLAQVSACWSRHCKQMLLIRSIFLYLDRSFVVAQEEAKEKSIYDMGLLQFRHHFQAQPLVQTSPHCVVVCRVCGATQHKGSPAIVALELPASTIWVPVHSCWLSSPTKGTENPVIVGWLAKGMRQCTQHCTSCLHFAALHVRPARASHVALTCLRVTEAQLRTHPHPLMHLPTVPSRIPYPLPAMM